MTDQELEADLRSDPETEELALEQGMTVDEYVAHTLAFLADPDRGFAGTCDGPDGEAEEGGGTFAAALATAFETDRPKPLPAPTPGEGVVGRLPAFRPRVYEV